MSVFISYNHKDSDFVDKLALELINHDVKVWKDKWEINVGDSLIDKIESGLNGASYLIAVLSKNSIKSRWVKKELNAALIREIDDEKLRIIPIRIDDCEIPLFLREKLYADFRIGFTDGLKQILSVVRNKYNLDGGGRVNKDTSYYFDFSIGQYFLDGKYYMDIDCVSFDLEEDFTILTQFFISSNHLYTSKPLTNSFAEEIKENILRCCGQEFHHKPLKKLVPLNKPITGNFTIAYDNLKAKFNVNYRVNCLGSKRNGAVISNIGALFYQICDVFEIDYK